MFWDQKIFIVELAISSVKGDRSLVAISLGKVLKIVLDFQLFNVSTGPNRETTTTLKDIVFNK